MTLMEIISKNMILL